MHNCVFLHRGCRTDVYKRQAAVRGATQVAGAIFASTLTTICVFLPIVFTQGLSRESVSYTHLDVYKRQVEEDAIPLDFAQPAEPVPVAETEPEPFSVEMPQATPAKSTGAVPVFNSTNRQEPLRRQVKAKPIDWNVDHFRQAQAESQPTPAPVQPLAPQQPAMTSAPVEPLQPQTVQPQEEPAWKQLLDDAISEQKGAPVQPSGEEATRVFEPAAVQQPVQPVAVSYTHLKTSGECGRGFGECSAGDACVDACVQVVQACGGPWDTANDCADSGIFDGKCTGVLPCG